ncbi:hypothetical protein QTP88_005086 [Uroleucon formosanum]
MKQHGLSLAPGLFLCKRPTGYKICKILSDFLRDEVDHRYYINSKPRLFLFISQKNNTEPTELSLMLELRNLTYNNSYFTIVVLSSTNLSRLARAISNHVRYFSRESSIVVYCLSDYVYLFITF